MPTPKEILVRAYLLSSDIEKVAIAKKIGAYDSSFNSLQPHIRDQEVFKLVRDKKLLQAMADALGLDIALTTAALTRESLEEVIIQMRNEIRNEQ